MAHITPKQIRVLLELDLDGTGLRRELQAFIRQVTSGGVAGKSDDPRVIQAKILWDLGFGRELKIDSFDSYLATIPEIPTSLLAHNPELPLLVLVDPRLRYVKSCRLAGLKYEEYGWTDETLVPVDDRHALASDTPYWVRAHDGSPNLNRRPSDCRAECSGRRYAGTADVGIAIWIQYGPRNHVMDLPGSVHAALRGSCAYVSPFGDPRLLASRDGDAHPECGTVVFVRE